MKNLEEQCKDAFRIGYTKQTLEFVKLELERKEPNYIGRCLDSIEKAVRVLESIDPISESHKQLKGSRK